MFADLNRLRYLDVSYNFVSLIQARFPASLQTLNLSYCNSPIELIETNSVKNLTNLLELTIHGGKWPALFSDDALLQKVVMYDPRLRDLQSLVQFGKVTYLTFCLSCIRSLVRYIIYLKQWDASLNYLSLLKFSHKALTSSTFQPLAKWNISLTHLEILNSADCYFVGSPLENIKDNTFSLFTNLQTLIVSNHFLSHLTENAFSGLTKLQELDLSNNRISVIPQQMNHL